MKIHFHKIDNYHYWCESRHLTLVTHDQKLNEWDCWECSCSGWFYRRDCEHVRQLCAKLYGPPRMVPARMVFKLHKATLEELYR